MGPRKHNDKADLRVMPDEDPEFQIAPMIDVLLVILVFFMAISSAEVLQGAEGIDLPVARDGRDMDPSPGEVVINVSWIPAAAVGGIEILERTYDSPDAMRPFLTRRVEHNPHTRVLIRADRAVRYEFMREIMRVAGESGISSVTFSVMSEDM